ncbi:MAG: PIN domain-containing protein, partial [Bacteroidales bacterium]|nr:PIN domain-containing protein [Bacteroidales bacterium]
MYLIDSDILIALNKGRGSIQERMNRVGISNCAISEISLAELYVGAYKSKSTKKESILAFLEQLVTIMPISPAIKRYAALRAQLETLGIRLEDMDLFIAATALTGDHTLVTHNTKHFS